MAYWLMKSEPSTYGIEDLEREGAGTSWDGVRNFQARNFLRAMKPGDQAFFYHSNCEQPGVVGIMDIVREAYPDQSALDEHSRYYDAKSTPQNPRWFVVDVRFSRKLARTVTLAEIKADAALTDLALVRRGNRLSVMPVSDAQWKAVLARV